jgi:hypothetical protein
VEGCELFATKVVDGRGKNQQIIGAWKFYLFFYISLNIMEFKFSTKTIYIHFVSNVQSSGNVEVIIKRCYKLLN